MRPKENEFSSKTRELLAKQAGYRCCNPDCDVATAGADRNLENAVSIGRAAHIHSAAASGPRFDASLGAEEVSSASNGIWLCANCADLIDKNNGEAHPPGLLRRWKTDRAQHSSVAVGKPEMSDLAGDFVAESVGEVTGLHVTRRNVRIQPGTTVTARGIGKVTGGKFE